MKYLKAIKKWEEKTRNLEENKSNVFITLWYGTAKEIAKILNSNHRLGAVKELKRLERKYSKMGISSYYKEALKDIK